jgi:cytochrome P450
LSGMQAPPPERPPDLGRVLRDLRDERSIRAPLPPGELGFSLARTQRFQRETLEMLLAYHARYGPVFSFRSLHRRIVALIGPEANHFVTVSGAQNFSWRKGMFGEQLTPLIGDGLITTDERYHDDARRIMMPAFHRRRMDATVEVMVQETTRALASWQPGDVVDVYGWVRELAMSTAMRALLGLDPREGAVGHRAAVLFERALSFYDTDSWKMLLRGPGSPWARMQAARRELDGLIFAEIERRRASDQVGDDVMSMLLAARDEQGVGFTALELRHQLMHLLFGGHDTTSSTLAFLLYELSRHPEALGSVLAEQDRVLGHRTPTTDELISGLPYLSMAVDETLRLYPPVWFGPRLSVRAFEFGGHRIPAGVHVIHSSWASHRLAEVFPDPDAFVPERFTPEARAALPRGAYIPFGAGQRVCIGKRFGQLMVKAVATTLLQRFRCELLPGYALRVSKLPTLSPDGGLPMRVGSRGQPSHSAPAPLAPSLPS